MDHIGLLHAGPDAAKAAASAFAGVALGAEPTRAGGAADVPLSKDGRLCFTPLTMHPEAYASTAAAASGDLTQTVVPRRRDRVARPLETLTGVERDRRRRRGRAPNVPAPRRPVLLLWQRVGLQQREREPGTRNGRSSQRATEEAKKMGRSGPDAAVRPSIRPPVALLPLPCALLPPSS
jgi:hypothetical protein